MAEPNEVFDDLTNAWKEAAQALMNLSLPVYTLHRFQCTDQCHYYLSWEKIGHSWKIGFGWKLANDAADEPVETRSILECSLEDRKFAVKGFAGLKKAILGQKEAFLLSISVAAEQLRKELS